MSPTLIETRRIPAQPRDNYEFSCSVCRSTIVSPYTALNTGRSGGPLPRSFPFQFCWQCGVRFEQFRLEHL